MVLGTVLAASPTARAWAARWIDRWEAGHVSYVFQGDAAAGFLRTGLAAEAPGAGEVRLPRYASGETSQRSVFVFFPACAGYVELSWDGQPLGFELFSTPEDMAAFRDAASAALPR